MSWTPELDECETAAGGTFCSGGSGFTFPDDEGKVEAVFEKNLDFARNVAATTLDRDRPDRPRNATDDETQYQVKGSPDIEPNRFSVSYGADADARGDRAPDPRPGRLRASRSAGPGGGSRTMTLARRSRGAGGERFGDLRGKYYQRVRAQIPADFVQPGTAQDAAAAGRRRRGQRPRDRGLPAAAVLLPRGLDAAGGRRQARARRRGRGLHGPLAQQDAVRRPRRATSTSTSRRSTANGYAVETYDIDAPPLGPTGAPASKQLSDLGVLSHFDAVLYYTGDDLLPQAVGQGVTDANYRRVDTPDARDSRSPARST